MLQFEFDIRDYKIANTPFKGMHLALGLVFLLLAILLFLFLPHIIPNNWNLIVAVVLLLLAGYFLGLRLGIKEFYPKEYLIINSRKLVYRIGRGSREVKIYRKNIKDVFFREEEMIVLQKDTTENHIDLTHLSPQAREVLKTYLEI